MRTTIFNKIHPFDLIVILYAILLIGAFLYWNNSKVRMAEKKGRGGIYLECVVRFKDVPIEIIPLIKKGDIAKDGNGNIECMLISIIENQEIVIERDLGEISSKGVRLINPRNRDILARLKILCFRMSKKDQRMYTDNQRQLFQVGTQYIFCTPDYFLSGKIERIP